jgi:hypothetical protein
MHTDVTVRVVFIAGGEGRPPCLLTLLREIFRVQDFPGDFVTRPFSMA